MAWLWRRKDRDAPAPEGDDAATADPTRASGAADDVIRQERSPTGDWMTLPPIATAGPIQPTFRVQTLPEILTSHHSPQVTGSMGHAVSAGAPSGVVEGLALATGAVRSGAPAAPDLTLRAPHPPTPPAELLAPARPLPLASPEPLAVAALPEPVVSRSVGDPRPLVTPAPRDVPVARVVDTTAPASPRLPEPAPLRADTGGSGATAAETQGFVDDRVGGFDMSALDDPVAGGHDELLAPAPGDLAPPIQPRTLQRRLAGARPIGVPPHLRTPSSESAPPSSPLDLPLHRPTPGAAEVAGPSPAAGDRSASPTPAPAADAHESGTTGLVGGMEATVQPQGADAHESGTTGLVGGMEATVQPQGADADGVPAPPPLDLPLQRRAADGPDAAGTSTSSASVEPGPEHTTPLAGETVDSSGPAEETISTVGPLSTAVQPDPLTTTGAATREQIGTPPAALPLAPNDWQETLDPPTGGAAPGPSLPLSAPSMSAASPTSATLAAPSMSAASPTSAPPEAPSGPLETLQRATASRTPLGAGGAAALPLAARPVAGQRPLSLLTPLTPATTSVGQRSAAAASAPAPTAPLPPLVHRPGPGPRELAAVAGTGGVAPAVDLPDVVTPAYLLAHPPTPATPPAAPEIPDVTDGSPLPLQRTADGAAAAAGGPRLPLHTPASSMPSAADIAVRAGLAERGPDGGLLYAVPPAGGDVAVQRFGGLPSMPSMPSMPSADALSSAVSDVSGRASDALAGARARGAEIASAAADALPSIPTLQELTQDLAEQARKLYPHIRTQLESDIRRQLEARNRGDRFRP